MANFKNIKPLTLKWEGGLSRAQTDTARHNPSPFVYNGKTGWHTSKGVTYSTFLAASKRFGFEPNEQNFIYMPDAIWDKIAKGMYWDALNLDNLKSDGVAFQLFSWYWGAGSGWFPRIKRYLSSKGIQWDGKASTISSVFNKLIDLQGEKKTISELNDQQIQFYISLNQPANTGGWVNRVKDTTAFAYKYIGKLYTENKKKINYALVGIALIAITFLTYKYYKKSMA